MKRDKTRIIALIIAIAMALSVIVPAVIWMTRPAFANSKLTEEQNLANQAKENKNKAQKERAELEAKNKELNKEIEALANDINALNSDIYEKEQQIKENEKRIEELDKEIEENDELLKTRLRIMYEQGTMSYMEILFSSGGFSDMLLRFEMVTQLYEHDMKLIDELNENRTAAKEAKAQIESDKEKIVSERDELLEKQSVFDSKVSENNSQVKKLKEDEAYYAKMQKEHEQAAQAILNEISSQKSGGSGSTTKVVSSGNGKLGLPCYAGAPVSSEFGSRILRGQPNLDSKT